MKKDSKSESPENLRQKAEALNNMNSAKPASKLNEDQIHKLIQNLQVHQIELELRNQELLLAKTQITADAKKYADLYDFAPTGYFTIAKTGEIIDLNLCGSQMIGRDRSYLKDKMLGLFVNDDSKPIFNHFLDKIFSRKSKETCEVTLQVNCDRPVYVNLSGTVTGNGDNCLIIATDISDRKQTQVALLESNEMFSAFMKHSPIYTFIKEVSPLESRVLKASENYMEMIGISGSEMAGKTMYELFPNEFAEKLTADDWKVVSNGEILKVGEDLNDRNYTSIKFPITLGGKTLLAGYTIDITEQKQTEEALKQSKVLLELALQSAGAGTWSWDMASQRLNWSNELYTMFGLDPRSAESTFDTWNMVVHPDDLEYASNCIEQAIKEKAPLNSEYRILHPNGQVRWINALGNTTYDDSGQPVRMAGLCTDITARKQAEEALRASEEQYRSLFNNFLDSVAVHQIVLDETGKPVDYIFIQANAAIETQTGLRITEILGKRATEVIPGIEKTPLIEIYGKVAITGEPVIFEHFFESFQRYFHINAFQVGKGRFCTVFQDISDARVAEKALEKSEEQFRTIFEKSVIGKSMTTLDGKLQINQAFCEMLGYSKDQLAEMDWQSITHPDDVEKNQAIIKSIISGEKLTARWEKRYIHQNGSIVWADISTTLQRDNEGKPLFFNTSVIDITERKRVEAELQESEKRYRSLLTNLEAGVIVHAPDTSIIMNNHRASELLGLSDDQMIGRLATDPNWKFVDEKNVPLILAEYPVNRIIASGKPFSNVLFGVVQPEKGNTVWLTVNGFPVFDGQGKIAEVLISFIDITERKRAEEALVQNRDLLVNLARLVPGVIYQYRLYPDGRSAFPYASPGMNDIYEVTPDEVQKDATPVFGRLHPADFDRVVDAIQESARTLNTFYCEYRVKLPRQGIRWRWSQAQPLRMDDGSILWHGIISDINDRKLAEEALIESEQKFRDTVTNLDEGYYSVTMDGVLLEHNQAFSRILGFDATANLKGVHLPDFWQNPEDRKDYLNIFFKYGSVSNYQLKVKNQFGEKKTVLVSAHLVTDKDQHPLRIEGVFLDITDRIRLEESLQRHTGRLQNLHKIDKAILSEVETPEAIIQKTLQHIRSLLSSQHASIGMFDFENETLQLFSSNIKDESMDAAKKYLINNALRDLEILREKRIDVAEDISIKSVPTDFQKILQSEEIISCINVPLISGEKLIGVMNLGWGDPRTFTPEELEIAGEVADEITVAIEQVRLRQAAKHYAEQLEKRVEERTSQLLAANKELEAFSYSVSHDLRAPLRHINGYISILSKHLKDKLSEKEKHYFDTIADSAHQMGKLIDDLLHFSRTGRQEMQLTSLDMNVVLKDALQVIQHESFGRGIKWVITSLPQITGDHALLRLVWLNLLSNAVKFSRINVTTQIEVGVVDDINQFVFFVRDNGVGFDMQYAHKLFGVFERLHSAQEFEGTGIGLANVRRIIQRHGGRTWAEAEVGKGATFYFSLPKG